MYVQYRVRCFHSVFKGYTTICLSWLSLWHCLLTSRYCVTMLDFHSHLGSRDRSVGIATRYGPGIESRWGRDFPHLSSRLWGPPSLLYSGYRVFPWSKTAGAWHWPTNPSSAEFKERVELYVYSPSGPSWPVLGWTLLYFTLHKVR